MTTKTTLATTLADTAIGMFRQNRVAVAATDTLNFVHPARTSQGFASRFISRFIDLAAGLIGFVLLLDPASAGLANYQWQFATTVAAVALAGVLVILCSFSVRHRMVTTLLAVAVVGAGVIAVPYVAVLPHWLWTGSMMWFVADAVVPLAAVIVRQGALIYTLAKVYLPWWGRPELGASLNELKTRAGEFFDLDRLVAQSPAVDSASRQIIGLCGYAGSGKDTVAAELLATGEWTRVSFADKLYDCLYALNPRVVGETVKGATSISSPLQHLVDTNGWAETKKFPEVRALLQRLGTDVGRNRLDNDVWVNAVMSNLPDGNLVFTDCRFPNEADAVRDAGGHLVRVTRPGVAAINAHISETALDDYPLCAVLDNDATPAAAAETLLTWLENHEVGAA